MGEVVVGRGEIWWGEAPDEKGRPYLVVSRDAANDSMTRVLVAPVTTRPRGAPSELGLGPDEGLREPCVASFDNLQSMAKALLVRRLGVLGIERRAALCDVTAATLDC